MKCYSIEAALYDLASIKIDEIIKEVTNNPNDSRNLERLEKIKKYINDKRISFAKERFAISYMRCVKPDGTEKYGGHSLWCPCDDHRDETCKSQECRILSEI